MSVGITPSAVEEALGRHDALEIPPLPGRRNHLRAAVLVPLIWDAELVTVLTVRSANLRLHAGEVVFPGGRREPADVDLAATAVREAREEVGIEGARILGTLSSIPLYTSDYRLEPFVAEVPVQRLCAQESEVAAILRVPVVQLVRREWVHAIPWTRPDGRESLSPVFEIEGSVVYGGTAYVLYELLEVMAPLVGEQAPSKRAGRYRWSDVLGPRAPQGT